MPKESPAESQLRTDIAALRARLGEAEAMLEASRETEIAAARLAAIVESSDDAIVGKDLRGTITSWNSGAERLFGYSAEEIVGHSILRLIPPERQAEEGEILARIARGESVRHFDTVRLRKDGSAVEISVTVSPIKDASGKIIGASKTARDISERKRMEVSAQQNAALFSTLIEQAPMGTYVVDGQLRVRQVNAQAMPVFASVQPLIGRDLREVMEILWGPEVGARCADIFRHTLATGERYVSPPFSETRVDLGMEQTYEWETQRVTLPDGHSGVVCYFHEVTERERALVALRQSEAGMRLAAEATGVGIWEWNLFTNAIHWDAELFRIYGIAPTPDGLVHYNDWSGAVLPEDLASNEAILQDTVRRGGRSVRQFRIRRRADGACRLIEAVETTRANAQGQTEWVVGTNLDITERKSGEEALRESEARFRDVADNISQLAWMTDETGWISWYNRRWFDFTGMTLPEMEGWGWQAVHHPDHVERVTEKFRRAIASGEPWEDTFPLRSRSGEYRWFLSRALPIRDGAGRIVRWFGTNTDITEMRAAEAALREAKAEAEAANRSKDHFLAVLSHELRTPLTPVLMAVGSLERDPSLPAEVREDLAMMRRNLDLEIKLIDDLLDLNRITNGKLALEVEAVDLNEIVRRVCAICRPHVGERGVALEVGLEESVGSVAADPARLQQVLWNVLRNAIKFTPEGGRIHVATARLTADRCEIRVRDTGVGIPPETLPRIFDAFEQGGGSINRQFGGLGLGLAICKALVALHDGVIRAESEGPDRGATFIIELPAQTPAPVLNHAPAAAAESSATLVRPRLLVVEDHADTAQALSRLLRRAGYTVTIAGDVASALEAAGREPFDILVSDLGLPDGTGNDLIRRLRETCAVRGIAMSGFGMDDDLRRSREAGFAEHLVKPIDIPRLEDAIRRVMRKEA